MAGPGVVGLHGMGGWVDGKFSLGTDCMANALVGRDYQLCGDYWGMHIPKVRYGLQFAAGEYS